MTEHILSDRKFGLIFAAFFAIFSTVGWFFFEVILVWALIACGLFAFFALVFPGALLPINRLWGVLTGRIHRVVNFTLLALFFFLVIFPAALIMRLLGRDALARAPDPKTASYWRPITRHTDETTLPDMF